LHVAADNERAADAVLDAIEVKCDVLRAFPEIGVAREDIRPGLRMLVSSEYVILYRLNRPSVDIVRVVHGRRDLEALKD
jgi:toxin ParE1/3/4